MSTQKDYKDKVLSFLIESEKIEGIQIHLPLNIKIWDKKLDVTINFLKLYSITTPALCKIAKVFEPKTELRTEGGEGIEVKLQELLVAIVERKLTPFEAHNSFESLHPFTDCNGRLGRLIWLWQMINQGHGWPELGFLHTWYYQSLQK